MTETMTGTVQAEAAGPEEKLSRVCRGFSRLNDEKQDYILGIVQALVFAEENRNENAAPVSENTELNGE